MSAKVVICLSCPTSTGTDQAGNDVTVWQQWDTDDIAGIREHQEANPDHVLIKGYRG